PLAVFGGLELVPQRLESLRHAPHARRDDHRHAPRHVEDQADVTAEIDGGEVDDRAVAAAVVAIGPSAVRAVVTETPESRHRWVCALIAQSPSDHSPKSDPGGGGDPMLHKGAFSRGVFLGRLFRSPTTISRQESSPGFGWLKIAGGGKF